MKTKLVAMIALGALASPLAALATETLTYTSADFTSAYTAGSPLGAVGNGSSTGSYFTITLTLSTPLAANLNDQYESPYVVAPLIIETIDGTNPSLDHVFNITAGEGNGSSVYFSTKNGVITGWDFTLGITEYSNVEQDTVFHSCYNESCVSGNFKGQNYSATGDWYDNTPGADNGNSQSDGCTYTPPGNCGSTAGSSGAVGSWSVTSAPELDPTSATSGLVVLVGSLAVLGGRRRRTSGFTAVA